ncbi:hypothetical protein [Rhodococcus globerulus]|uniref:hypothetical protein n=1 Tax=Rhodococcus globerulus TaxID=33008 RepID=UPI000B2494CE|nr:hypothetical protein [Rhodococcus globerulus]
MPLTAKYSEKYNDALIALAAATQRPTNVVNLDGIYAIRVDLEYSRYVVATNSPRGLSDEPDANGSWLVCIYRSDLAGVSDELLVESTAAWLIDAFDSALARLESGGNKIEADADFGDISRCEGSTPLAVDEPGSGALSGAGDHAPVSAASLNDAPLH